MVVQKIHRYSTTISFVGVESLAALAPKISLTDHLSQKGGWCVLVVS